MFINRAVRLLVQASYHTLLSGYAKTGLYKQAEQVLTYMEMAGIKAELYTYTILIQAYANSKQPGRAMAIYSRLKDNNIEPDQAVFQMMLDAFSKAGLVEFAERVVHAMRSHGYEANAYTMVELIHLYCRVSERAWAWSQPASDLGFVSCPLHAWRTALWLVMPDVCACCRDSRKFSTAEARRCLVQCTGPKTEVLEEAGQILSLKRCLRLSRITHYVASL